MWPRRHPSLPHRALLRRADPCVVFPPPGAPPHPAEAKCGIFEGENDGGAPPPPLARGRFGEASGRGVPAELPRPALRHPPSPRNTARGRGGAAQKRGSGGAVCGCFWVPRLDALRSGDGLAAGLPPGGDTRVLLLKHPPLPRGSDLLCVCVCLCGRVCVCGRVLVRHLEISFVRIIASRRWRRCSGASSAPFPPQRMLRSKIRRWVSLSGEHP